MGLVSPWYHVEEPYGRVWGREPRYFIVSNNTGLDFELDIALGYSWVGHPTYAGASATILVGCLAISSADVSLTSYQFQ